MYKMISLENVRIEAADQAGILDMIDPVDLAYIKKTDPHPFFQLYSFAHEGTSRPAVVGMANPPVISWPRKAIETIKNIVIKGTKLFRDHRKTGEVRNRKEIGTVVASEEKEIDGKLHHLIVTYHPPEVKTEAIECDACSQEAEWSFFEKAGMWVAEKIEKIKAIAGLNSKTDRPAFSGAYRLAAIEAAHIYDKDQSGEDRVPGEGKGEIVEKQLKDFGFAEIIKHIKEERNARARDLVTIEDLMDDRQFAPMFDEVENLKKTVAALEEEKKKIADTMENLKKKELITTAKTRIEGIINDLKIDNDIIKKQLLSIAESSPEKDDDSIKVEANRILEIQKAIIQQQEDKTKIPTGNRTDQDKSPDYRTAKDNPLIKE